MEHEQTLYLPNWKEAEIHGQSSKVGFYDETSKDQCSCCHQKRVKEPIPLNENTKSLEFLGFGFPLFYMFIRNCLILLLLLIISKSFLSLFISIQDGQQYCNANASSQVETSAPHHFLTSRSSSHFNEEDPNLYLSSKCHNFLLMMARTDKDPNDYELIARICSFIIHLLALLYIKDKIIKTWAYYDEMESDLSDYAVIIKNIPKGLTGIDERLRNFITKEIIDEDKKPFEVHQIILIPDEERIHDLNSEYQEFLDKYLHAKTIGQPHIHELAKELQKLRKEKKDIAENTIQKINEDTIEANDAIIIFETEPQKEYFLSQAEQYQNSGKLGNYFGNPVEPLEIEEAPEPREFIYQNLQYSHQRMKNICIGWGLSFAFLILITIIFYFIQLVKTNNMVAAVEELEENPDSSSAAGKKTIASMIAWVTLLGIVFFNKFVMGNVLHYFTHLEKHDNKAHEDFSFAFKYALGMFFTTALMTIAVEAISFGNYYKHDFGVIEEETIMFILCAFLVPLIWIIHPLQQCHVYARNKHYGHNDVTQHEANHLMADYHYDMGKRYAQIIEMMWFTFLYSDLIPIGAFLIFVGFCIYYWVDKYNLLRRSSLEGNISGDLTIKCLYLLDFTLFWRFLGELIFDIQIRGGAKTLTIILLSLSILFLVIPWESVLDFFNEEKFKLNSKKFTDEKHRFDDDNYKIYHPIYSEIISNQHAKGGQFQLDINELFLHAKKIAANPKSAYNASPIPNLSPNPNPQPSNLPNQPVNSNSNSSRNNSIQLPPSNISPATVPFKPTVNFNYK